MAIVLDKKLCEKCFFWNAKVWSKPFLQALQDSPKKRYNNTLEVGAGIYSSLSPFLSTISKQVECSYYDESTRLTIKKNNDALCEDFGLNNKCNIRYSFQDILGLKGQYDLIVVKSISGGVFRLNQSELSDFDVMVKNIVSNNLTDGGELYLIENGESIISPLINRFGARANSWRFFKKTDFTGFNRYYSFGVLSAFSFATRLGSTGLAMENLFYYLDFFLSKIFKNHTVHVVVYRND